MLLENKNAIIYGAGGAIGSGVGVKSCTLTFRIFRRSHHVVNMRARSCCFSLGRIIRDYPPSPAEGLTSNERSVALSLFRSVSAQPAAPDTLCVGYAPERRYLERRLQEIEKKWLDVCRIWGPPND